VLKMWHSLFSSFLPAASGLTWALSIVFLVITVRVLLFRLFVKQVRSQRAMQELQPEIAKLKKQYGSDRQGMAQAMSALQKERGVNPLAGCLPILPQIPVFIGLLHVLRRLRPGAPGLYGWDDTLTDQAASAKVFGAPISSAFFMPDGVKTDSILALPAELGTIRVVTTVLIVVMCLTTFFTQKQIMSRSGPVEGQAALIQKLLLYGMPLGLFASSFFFPLGVLMYWFINNLWTLGQQFYILKKLPPPGSAGALAKAAAERPKVDPKDLAPKPGAKPVRGPKGRTPVVDAATAAKLDDLEGGADVATPVTATAKASAPGKRATARSTTASSNGSSNGRSNGSSNGRSKRSAKPPGQGAAGSQPNVVSHGDASGGSSASKQTVDGNGSASGNANGSAIPDASRAKAGSGARPADRPGANKNRRKRR
ncbi:MAG: membrane protein insertase YidC, partial [Geodermatophilaceae bacterium]